MPLTHPPTAQTPQSLYSALRAAAILAPTSPPTVILFSASPDEGGEVWDRACVDMATLVGRVLDGEGVEGVEGMVVHVGDRETWQNESNPWRQPPFSLSSIPTLVKYVNQKLEKLECVNDQLPSEEEVKAFVKPEAAA